jgi:hypothetical protein
MEYFRVPFNPLDWEKTLLFFLYILERRREKGGELCIFGHETLYFSTHSEENISDQKAKPLPESYIIHPRR